MISIIVPVYNAERFLRGCLDSILNSTYPDFEVILVDDGSTDGSGLICDQYQEWDNRIKVIHQQNNGISSARNAGLSCASGEFITFADADDFIHPLMLEAMKRAINSGDYDFSMVGHCTGDENELAAAFSESSTMQLSGDYYELTQEAFLRGLLDNSTVALKYNFVWNKLYKRSLIENMRFVKTAIEDLEWNCRVCAAMNKAVVVPDKLYYYLFRAGTTSRGINERYLDRVNSYYLCLQDIPEEKKAFRTQCLDMVYKVMVYSYYDIGLKGDREKLKEYQKIRSNVYHKTRKDFLNSQLGWPKKVILLLLYHFPCVYPIFKKVFDMRG